MQQRTYTSPLLLHINCPFFWRKGCSCQSQKCRMIKQQQQPGRVWHVKTPCVIPLFNCYPLKKGSFWALTLEGYFLCGNKSLDFTSHLRTNPIQQAASPGALFMYSVQGCSPWKHSGAAKRSWLVGDSPNGREDMAALLARWSIPTPSFPQLRSLYIQKQLMKESS